MVSVDSQVSSDLQRQTPLHILMQSDACLVLYVAGCALEAQVAISFGYSCCAMDLLKFPAHFPTIICGYEPPQQSSGPSVSYTRRLIME